MTFDSTDWDAETRRIARAFGVAGSYKFEPRVLNSRESMMTLTRVADESMPETIPNVIPLENGLTLRVYYTRRTRFFAVVEGVDGALLNTVHLNWDGTAGADSQGDESAQLLAKALLHLDLLTPEVEAALQVSISQHQKMEWTLEYEARYGEQPIK